MACWDIDAFSAIVKLKLTVLSSPDSKSFSSIFSSNPNW